MLFKSPDGNKTVDPYFLIGIYSARLLSKAITKPGIEVVKRYLIIVCGTAESVS